MQSIIWSLCSLIVKAVRINCPSKCTTLTQFFFLRSNRDTIYHDKTSHNVKYFYYAWKSLIISTRGRTRGHVGRTRGHAGPAPHRWHPQWWHANWFFRRTKFTKGFPGILLCFRRHHRFFLVRGRRLYTNIDRALCCLFKNVHALPFLDMPQSIGHGAALFNMQFLYFISFVYHCHQGVVLAIPGF